MRQSILPFYRIKLPINILVFYQVHKHVYNNPVRCALLLSKDSYSYTMKWRQLFCEQRVVSNELQDLTEQLMFYIF